MALGKNCTTSGAACARHCCEPLKKGQKRVVVFFVSQVRRIKKGRREGSRRTFAGAMETPALGGLGSFSTHLDATDSEKFHRDRPRPVEKTRPRKGASVDADCLADGPRPGRCRTAPREAAAIRPIGRIPPIPFSVQIRRRLFRFPQHLFTMRPWPPSPI